MSSAHFVVTQPLPTPCVRAQLLTSDSTALHCAESRPAFARGRITRAMCLIDRPTCDQSWNNARESQHTGNDASWFAFASSLRKELVPGRQSGSFSFICHATGSATSSKTHTKGLPHQSQGSRRSCGEEQQSVLFRCRKSLSSASSVQVRTPFLICSSSIASYLGVYSMLFAGPGPPLSRGI